MLIGRGRSGWTFDWGGQGSANAVRSIPTGVAAFAPAALPSATVNALYGGHTFEYFTDGIRLRRARDASGATWQEVRLHTAAMRSFTWEMDSGQALKTVQFDTAAAVHVGPSGSWRLQSTFDVTLDDAYHRIHTAAIAAQNSRMGFAYGRGIAGNSKSNSYLWSVHSGAPFAIPFTQVWLRPRLSDANVGFAPIPNGGTPASTLPMIPGSTPQLMSWGVTKVQIPATDPDPLGASPVQGLAQIGSTMYVGGKFRYVAHHTTGGLGDQPWLAAFDVNTGVWRSTFRPQLDGAVFDLVATPGGQLLVAGNFTNVNNAPNTAGLALLDPITGAVSSVWSSTLTIPRFGSPRPYARSVAIEGNWAYVAGSFNRITGGPGATAVAVGGVGRVSLTDGTPDVAWRVYADRTPMDLAPSADPSRVYLAGFFAKIGTTNANMAAMPGLAVLNTTDGAVVPGLGAAHFNTPDVEQLAVTEIGGHVFHGGNQRWLAQYTEPDLGYLRGETMANHGDIQVLAQVNGFLIGGCHCLGWSRLDPNMARVDRINWVGAWDPITLDRLPSFDPKWRMAGTGEGGWELLGDSSGCLWVGGDVIQGARTTDWLGGFARFCPGDTTAPIRPSIFKAISHYTVTWSSGSDNSHIAPSYEILRNDRVIAMLGSNVRSYTVPGHGRYFVRAVDTAGNRSATTRVVIR